MSGNQCASHRDETLDDASTPCHERSIGVEVALQAADEEAESPLEIPKQDTQRAALPIEEEACVWPDETPVTVCPGSCKGRHSCHFPGSDPIAIGWEGCIGTEACYQLGRGKNNSLSSPVTGTTTSHPVSSKAWRIRNAAASSSNAWALRGLRFCLDANCTSVASGEPFDSGNSPEWGPASALFDDAEDPSFSNFWKSFDGNKVGEAYVGLVFDQPISVQAIAIRPDNAVYGIDTVFVEYRVEAEGEEDQFWETYTVLTGVPKHYGDVAGYWIANLHNNKDRPVATTVGNSTCQGTSACKRRVGSVGHNSCNGSFACNNAQASEGIGDYSCNAAMACHNTTGRIGSGSCNSHSACLWSKGAVGDCVQQCWGNEGSRGSDCAQDCRFECPADEGIFDEVDEGCKPLDDSSTPSTSMARMGGSLRSSIIHKRKQSSGTIASRRSFLAACLKRLCSFSKTN